MTLVAAAVCPHPPLLVPEVGSGAADELQDVRAWCADAVDALHAAQPDALYVIGADIGLRASGCAPWGVDVPVDVPEPLALPLLVGAWLTRGRPRHFVSVDPDLPPHECAALGGELAASADRVALLVMGDGSARRDEKAPGYVDPRAASYDEEVARALADVDPATLLDLDAALSAELMVAGRAPWQVLAGAAQAAPRPGAWVAWASGHVAPYGVGYHVTTWLLSQPGTDLHSG